MKATDDQILGFIAGYCRKNGYSPSIREICAGVGIKAPSDIRYRLRRLREEGRVTYVDRVARTIRVMGDE